jgi:hypothetical protein
MQQSISQKIMTQRYYSLLLNSVGEMLTINFISGDIIEGLLDSIDPFNNEYFIINNPRRLSRTGVPIFLKESKLKIYFKDISHINYDIKKFIPQIKNNFETDLQISKKSQKREKGEKKLVKYEINENNKNKFAFQSLEDDFGKDEEKLDQFEINKKRYNIVSTYDENLYTTKLDKKNITKEQQDYADKIYNEIKNSSTNEKNIHILEDRGIIDERDGDINEEEKYSSVIKNNNKSNNINKMKEMNIHNIFNDNSNNLNDLNNLNTFNQNNNNFINFNNSNNNNLNAKNININYKGGDINHNY